MIGVVRDPTFGPVITFGSGGTEVEIFSDRAVALPPLNRFLVKDLINSTRAAQLLGEFRQHAGGQHGSARRSPAQHLRNGLRAALAAGTRSQSADRR
jgi:hypothetical protein